MKKLVLVLVLIGLLTYCKGPEFATVKGVNSGEGVRNNSNTRTMSVLYLKYYSKKRFTTWDDAKKQWKKDEKENERYARKAEREYNRYVKNN